MPLQKTPWVLMQKSQNKSREKTNDACSAKRRSYARRHGKGIMAVYEGGF